MDGLPFQASPELLVATGEGALMLWSFEKHKVARFFDPISAVTSVLWSQKAPKTDSWAGVAQMAD